MLPGSTERVLSVAGVADAVHIATFYIGTVLVEAASRSEGREGGGGAGGAYRPGAQAQGGAPGGAGRFERAPQPVEVKPGMSTQNVWVPNELVGPLIGKGGAKINEVRQASQTQVRLRLLLHLPPPPHPPLPPLFPPHTVRTRGITLAPLLPRPSPRSELWSHTSRSRPTRTSAWS